MYTGASGRETKQTAPGVTAPVLQVAVLLSKLGVVVVQYHGPLPHARARRALEELWGGGAPAL